MSSRKQELAKIEIPNFVFDQTNQKKYKKGKFLGRGGFAKCYELIDCFNNKIFAGKVIAKAQLQKSDQKEKMSQEIFIHRSIHHKNIVDFHSYFEDSNHIYIVLELCSKRSLMEMHKRRKTLTEPEVRYFVRQIADACDYLHRNQIVHRDLKLGNLFLNDSMDLKVGDFGLATKITNGERKLTLCGTPNYIAPEVLLKKGHGHEVDIWSLGCIVYTLIVGKPPFETNDLKDTYRRIRHNDYHIPSIVPYPVKAFIEKMLQADPKIRPTMEQILNDTYMKNNYIPSRIPQSCLTTTPRFDYGRLSMMPVMSPRRPLVEMNQDLVKNEKEKEIVKPANNGNQGEAPATANNNNNNNNNNAIEPAPVINDFNLNDLRLQLIKLLESKPEEKKEFDLDDIEDPVATPIFWISKWVDYTERYGIGFQLCDNSVGVVFNDITRISLFTDGHNVQYIERNGSEHYHSIDNYPSELVKKVTLLKYFRNYMNEHLLKTGEKPKLKDEDELSRLPHLNNWFRTRNAIVFQLTNGTVQINFFQDHTKLILCPLMGAVTFINEKRDFRTFRFSLIEKYGASKELIVRIKYARDIVERLLTHKLRSKSTNRT